MTRPAEGDRGGFVLPVAILLVLVVGLVAGVILTRAGSQAREVRRQVEATSAYHHIRGLRQTMEDWVVSTGTSSLAELTDPDGLVLTLEPGDRRRLRIYMFDAQGGLPTNIEAAPAQFRPVLALARTRLEERLGPAAAQTLLRSHGPHEVSVRSAPRAVLEALAGSITSPSRAAGFASAVVEARSADEAEITRARLGELMSQAELDPAERTQLTALLAANATLWEMVIDEYPTGPGSGRLQARHRALAVFRGLSSVGQDLFEQPSAFVAWRTDTVDGSTEVPPRPSLAVTEATVR